MSDDPIDHSNYDEGVAMSDLSKMEPEELLKYARQFGGSGLDFPLGEIRLRLRELDRLRIEANFHNQLIPDLNAEIVRLRKLLDEAPHGTMCDSKVYFPKNLDRVCDCWKSKVGGGK